MTLGDIKLIGQMGEIDNPFEIEREINVQMDPEQRISRHRVEFPVKLFVFVIADFRSTSGPERIFIVDFFPFKVDRYRQEVTELLDHLTSTIRIQKLFLTLIQMENDFGTTIFFVGRFNTVLSRPLTLPVNCLSILLIGESTDLNIVCNHKTGIETQTKVTDNLIFIFEIFKLFDKIFRR